MSTDDLQTLKDTLAIQQLIARYARAVDWMDVDAMAACFAAGAAVRFGTLEIPAPDFCGFWKNMGSAFKARHHHMGIPVIDLQGARAFAEATAIIAGTRSEANARLRNFMECNRYLFEMAKGGDGWRFIAARILITWSDGAPTPAALEFGGAADHDVDVHSPFFVKL